MTGVSSQRVEKLPRIIDEYLGATDDLSGSRQRVLRALCAALRRGVSRAIFLNDLLRPRQYKIASIAANHWASAERPGLRAFAAELGKMKPHIRFKQCALSQFAFEQAGLDVLEGQISTGAAAKAIDRTIAALISSAAISHEDYMEQIVPLVGSLPADWTDGVAPLSAETREAYRRELWETSAEAGSLSVDERQTRFESSSESKSYQQERDPGSLPHPPWPRHLDATPWRRILLYVMLILAIALAVLGGSGIHLSLSSPIELIAASALLVLAFGVGVPVAETLIGSYAAPADRLRLDFCQTGLPNDCQVVMAVPVVLVSKDQIDAVLVNATWNLLTAADTNVCLALLTDHRDSICQEPTPDEVALHSYIQTEVIRLRAAGRRVTLLHRARNQFIDEKWIGWERKRGKLLQLNELILSGVSRFQEVTGDVTELIGARYVLSLDEDSRLSRDCIQRLAGVLAHPCNQPRWNSNFNRFEGGYGMVVPRFVTREGSLRHWRFPGAFCGFVGCEREPVEVTRNFLFDWIGRTQYPGKGLYDVRQFQRATSWLPEGCILSHDTIEGALVRCAYEGGSVISEAFPASLGAFMRRIHRWTRGDMQNYFLFWLFARPPIREALTETPFAYTVNMQLRSTLGAPALSLAFLPWIFGTAHSSRILLATMTLVVTPSLVQTMRHLFECRCVLNPALVIDSVGKSALSVAMRLSCCWTHAWIVGSAMLHALAGIVLQRRLLEWQSAAASEAASTATWKVPGVAGASAAALVTYSLALTFGSSFARAWPLLVWAIYPALAPHIVSRRVER